MVIRQWLEYPKLELVQWYSMQEQDRRRGHGQLGAMFAVFVLGLQSLLLGRDVYFQGRDSIHVLHE